MYDFSEYTANELCELLNATLDGLKVFRMYPCDKKQVAHDEAMCCEIIDEITRRDQL